MALTRPYGTEVETGSDAEERGRLCDACKSDGESRRAVKYCLDCNQAICQSCVDSHRRIKQIKDHKLVNTVDGDAMKVSQFLSNCLTCPNHPSKTIELVCKQHDAMCCLTCATINHRGCSELKEIASEACAIDMARNIKDLADHFEEAKKYMEGIVKVHNDHNMSLLVDRDYTIPTWLRDLKTNVQEALAAIETAVLQEYRKLEKYETEIGNTEMDQWETLIGKVANASTLLKSVEKNGPDVHIYATANKYKKILAEIDEMISKQGDRIQRRNITVKECLQLKQVYMGNPKEIVSVSVENVAFRLPPYKWDQKKTKHPVGTATSVRQNIEKQHSSSQYIANPKLQTNLTTSRTFWTQYRNSTNFDM